MAEYRTLTGEFVLSCAVNKTTSGTPNVEWNSKIYVGTNYFVRLVPKTGDEAFSYTDTSKVVGTRIKVRYKREMTTTTNVSVTLRYGKTTNNTTDAYTWYVTSASANYYSHMTSFVPAQTLEETEILLYQNNAYTTELGNAVKYGCSMSYDADELIQILGVTLELDVADEYVPPEISFLAENGVMVDGTYHHDPNKAFLVSVDYTQAADVAINRLQATVTGVDTKSEYYGELSDTYLYIAAQYWSTLPRNGVLTIVANNGYANSNTLIIPYVVDEYDVHFTSPTSGSVIQSDQDLTISWEAVAPSTQTMDAPSKYLMEIWYDDGDGTGGDYTTLTSKTITADQFTGHSQVHMRLYSHYIMCEDSKDHAPVMNLYIQQVAGTGNVQIMYDDQTPSVISIIWESTGQTAYQVRVGDFTSDIVWGDQRWYKVPFVLGNEKTYTISVRIQDAQGSWTDWTEPLVYTASGYLNDYESGLSANRTEGGVEVSISMSAGVATYYYATVLYRNDIPIAVLDNAEEIKYMDTGANGKTIYRAEIVFIYSGSTYGDIASYRPVTIDATPSTDGLVLSDKTWLPLRYTTDTLRYSGSASEEVYPRYYSGRSYPVVMRSGRRTETLSLSYADPTGALADRLIGQVGTTVLFKNRDGLKFWGILESVTPTRHRGWCEVSFVLRRVDVNEWVPLIW